MRDEGPEFVVLKKIIRFHQYFLASNELLKKKGVDERLGAEYKGSTQNELEKDDN